MEWQYLADLVADQVKPERAATELREWIKEPDIDEASSLSLVTGFVAEFTIQMAGMAAAFVQPPEDPSAALHGLADRLSRLDFEAGAPEAAEIEVDNELDDLIERLYEGEAALTPDLVQSVAAFGEEAVERLIELAQDEDLQSTDSPGEGWTPIHAAELLGKLRAAEAVPALIDALAAAQPMEIIRDTAIRALVSIGPPALPAALETVRYTRKANAKADLASILGKLGRGNPATFDALVALFRELEWDEFRVFAAMGLGDLGDRRAVPILQEALDSPGITDLDRTTVLDELDRLGAKPAARPQRPSVSMPRRSGGPHARLGRNDRCWCGSGKKYKYCHLTKDQQSGGET